MTVVEPNTPPSITLPSAQQTATVGKSLDFTVSAQDQNIVGDPVTLSATGLIKNMAFNPTTGVFTFTPDQSQAGQTFNVNFTATYSDNPSASSNRMVAIKTESSTGQPSTPGVLPSGISATLWLVTIGAVIGVVSAIALLHVRASAQLASARRRSRSIQGQTGPRRALGTRQHSRSSTERTLRRETEDD